MRLLFRAINLSSSSRNLVTNNCKQSMRGAQLKTFNVKEKHENLFNQMIQKPGLLFLKDVFINNGFGIRIAGGAVRDLIYEKVPDDIDLATTAVPETMIDMLSKFDNVRLITTKAGERHGTIIARIDDKAQYEITTLRIDKNTDGRHAEVEFIQDWEMDASRRDLTFNSLFLDFDGEVYDYFNGIEHLKNKKVLFVGDPVERMEEDFLRILRYFRFYIRYGNLVDHDKSVIDAIEKCKEGLDNISGPRIWTELKKILSYSNSCSVLPVMFNQLKLGKFIGFSEKEKSMDRVKKVYDNLNKFNSLVQKSIELTKSNQSNDLNLNDDDKKLNSMSIISALIDDDKELMKLRDLKFHVYSNIISIILNDKKELAIRKLHKLICLPECESIINLLYTDEQITDLSELRNLRERLMLSNQELYTLAAIMYYREKNEFNTNNAMKEIVLTSRTERDRKKLCLLEVFKYKGDLESYLKLKNRPIPEFPNISKHMLEHMSNRKSQMGRYLEMLTHIWADDGFKMSKEELIEKFNQIYKQDDDDQNNKRLKT